MMHLKRMAAILLAALVLASCLCGALADEESFYTPVTGTSATFRKYLVLDQNANVPGVTFTFTIAPGSAQAAYVDQDTGARYAAVYAGDDARVTGAPTAGTAAFAATDAKLTTVATGDQVTLASGEAYVVKNVSVDFSGVSFKEPGIYRYVITEDANTYNGVTNDSATTRVLDVYVISDLTQDPTGKTLKIAAYLLHTGDDAAPLSAGGEDGTAVVDKDDGFTNSYATKNLTFKKLVAGNQGSRVKYFKFTVTLTGGAAGTVYTVDLTNADATAGDKTNPASVTVGEDGTVTQDFWLKHGQSISILGIALNSGYTITEDKAALDADKYTVTATVEGDTKSGDVDIAMDANYAVSDTGLTENATVTYTNTKDGTIPTGVMLTIVPGVVIALIAVAGLMLLRRRRAEHR